MKLTKLIPGIICAAGLLAYSCNVTDLEPSSSLTKGSFYKTEDDANAAVIAVYSGLTDFNTTLQLFHWGDARADQTSANVWWGQSGDVQLAKKQLLNPSNFLAEWGPMYTAIQRCNDAIKNISAMPVDPQFSQSTKNNLLGEARTLRAYCYFTLARVFGEVPLVLEPSDRADKDYMVPKSTEAEVLNQIELDLDSAIAGMGNPELSAAARRRASRGAAKALKVHVKLWRNQYLDAEAAATDLITKEAYSLEPTPTYMNQFWTSGGTNEIIFSLGFDNVKQNPVLNRMSWNGGGYGIIPARVWFNKFKEDPVRGKFRNFLDIDDDGYGLILKYQGNGNTDPSKDYDVPANTPRDYPIFRLADVYLLRAEARNRIPGKEAEALADLNLIRKRANNPEYQPADLATLEAREDAILEERNIELAFEGQRWFDLTRVARHGRPEVLYDEATNLLSGTQKEEAIRILRDKGPKSWFYPISRTELLNNNQLKQNEAYE
jgi:hypothetical protein